MFDRDKRSKAEKAVAKARRAEAARNRDAARAAGETTYQGRPCRCGADGTRFTAGRVCTTCGPGLRAYAPDPAPEDPGKYPVHQAVELTVPTRAEVIRNKKEAKASKARTYLGFPCKHDHHGYRYTTSGKCIECFPAKPTFNPGFVVGR